MPLGIHRIRENEERELRDNLVHAYSLLARARSFAIAPRLTVDWRDNVGDESLWVISNNGLVLRDDGEFVYEPSPSNRSEEFIARTRFSLDDAMRIADELIYTHPDRNFFFQYHSEIPFGRPWNPRVMERKP